MLAVDGVEFLYTANSSCKAAFHKNGAVRSRCWKNSDSPYLYIGERLSG
jgi:hypothetical protein